MKLRIGELVLDTEARQLARDGREVRLRPKAYELLELLVASRPQAVSRQRLRERLWPDTHVVDGSLDVLIGQLRKALGDDPQKPHWVLTVPSVGYALSGDAQPETDAPDCPWRCRVAFGGREIVLRVGENAVGRARDASVWIDDHSVSRRHAIIRVGPDGVLLEDCGSRNGTLHLRRPVTGVVSLRNRDEVVVGGVLLTILLTHRHEHRGGSPPSTSPVAAPSDGDPPTDPVAAPEGEI